MKGVVNFAIFCKSHKSIESKLLCQVMRVGADQTFKEFLGFMSFPINLIPIKFNAKVPE